MTRDIEQERDWEELSRLREENRILRAQNADLKRKVRRLTEHIQHHHEQN